MIETKQYVGKIKCVSMAEVHVLLSARALCSQTGVR